MPALLAHGIPIGPIESSAVNQEALIRNGGETLWKLPGHGQFPERRYIPWAAQPKLASFAAEKSAIADFSS
jgi:hypothetical protein